MRTLVYARPDSFLRPPWTRRGAASGPGWLPMVVVAGLLLPASGAGQEWRELTQSRRASGERGLQVELQYGAGRLEIRPGEPGTLYRIHLRYREEESSPSVRYADGRLEVAMAGRESRTQLRRTEPASEMILSLPGAVPTDLNLEFGAVRASLELGGVPLRSLRLATGASETRLAVSRPNPEIIERARFQVGAASFEARDLGNLNARTVEVEAAVGDVRLDFAGRWDRDANISVKMGLGALSLAFPSHVGVRLERRGFLSPLRAVGLEQRGSAWYSPGYQDAPRKVTVEVEAALGSVEVRWGG